jgi:hypothetical protein
MKTGVAMGTTEIRLRKGATGSSAECRGPNCNKPAEYFNRTFHADGSITTWPCDAAGKPVAMFSACTCAIDDTGAVTCKCLGECDYKSKGVAMMSSVTADEKTVCVMLGTSEAKYVAARDRRQQQMRGTAPAVALDARTIVARVPLKASDVAAEVCRDLGITETAFAASFKRRRAGEPLVLMANKENAPSGIVGPPIVGEALEQYRDEIESEAVDSQRLVTEARKAIDEFWRNRTGRMRGRLLRVRQRCSSARSIGSRRPSPIASLRMETGNKMPGGNSRSNRLVRAGHRRPDGVGAAE